MRRIDQDAWPPMPKPIPPPRSGRQMYEDATAERNAERNAAHMFALWTADRVRLRRWRLACFLLVLAIVSGLAGIVWSHLS